jgi:hypothetical protein
LFSFALALIDRTPLVFLFPLLFVTTAVFDDTLLLFVFAGRFAFVSTTPWRGGLPALLFAWFEFVSVVLHPARKPPTATTSSRAKVLSIRFCSLRVGR